MCSGAPAAGISPHPAQGLTPNKSIFHLLEPQLVWSNHCVPISGKAVCLVPGFDLQLHPWAQGSCRSLHCLLTAPADGTRERDCGQQVSGGLCCPMPAALGSAAASPPILSLQWLQAACPS